MSITWGKSKSGKPRVVSFNITEAQFHQYEADQMGLCLACGDETSCCEPDARGYQCECCDEKAVYGVPELLLMGRVTFQEDAK